MDARAESMVHDVEGSGTTHGRGEPPQPLADRRAIGPRLIRRYQYVGQLRIYANMLYLGMRHEFYHCHLIFKMWADALEGFLATTSAWDVIVGPDAAPTVPARDAKAREMMAEVRGSFRRALNVLWDVASRDLAPRKQLRDPGAHQLQLAVYVRELGKAAVEVRTALLTLCAWQQIEQAECAEGGQGLTQDGHNLANDIQKMAETAPPSGDAGESPRALRKPRVGFRNPSARVCEEYRLARLTRTLRELEDLLDDRFPRLSEELLDAVGELAVQNDTLTIYFYVCLWTRLSAQLTAQAAVFDPDELTRDPHNNLLTVLHQLVDGSREKVRAGPTPLVGAVAHRAGYLSANFPNQRDWVAHYFKRAADPSGIGFDRTTPNSGGA